MNAAAHVRDNFIGLLEPQHKRDRDNVMVFTRSKSANMGSYVHLLW